MTDTQPDLVAHGRMREEIARYIDADDIVFQGLEDLKAACMDAADSKSQVEDFEVGVFCGKYVTDVPRGYFDHLSDLRKGKKDAASGPVNVPAGGGDAKPNGVKIPEHREDIRYVSVAVRDVALADLVV